MTRQPLATRQSRTEEAYAAMAKVFGVHVTADTAAAPPAETTAPEPPYEETERRAAMGRVFGTEV